MPDHSSIYLHEAEKYEELISRQPKLGPIMEEIRAFAGLDIVDMGAGTGRLTTVLAPHAKSIIATDASAAMLQITADKLRKAGLTNWQTKVADHRKLPLPDNSADLFVAGWTICYLASSNAPDHKQNLQKVMAEIRRVLRPGGTVVLFETMGTGAETPDPPSFLQEYYASLAGEYGFTHKWIRMDYEFASISQAEELTRFFFGDELADRVLAQNLQRLPECAGIWWRHF